MTEFYKLDENIFPADKFVLTMSCELGKYFFCAVTLENKYFIKKKVCSSKVLVDTMNSVTLEIAGGNRLVNIDQLIKYHTIGDEE